jgi:hypothetical protein
LLCVLALFVDSMNWYLIACEGMENGVDRDQASLRAARAERRQENPGRQAGSLSSSNVAATN